TFAHGSFSPGTVFSTPRLPTRIAAADLLEPIGSSKGLDDIVVLNALDNSIQVAFQQAPGKFGAPITLLVGVTPSDVALVDVNGDGFRDIVVTDQANGDVSVLFNIGPAVFSRALRFRAGIGLFATDAASGGSVVSSLAQSVSLAAGDFTGNGLND